MEITMSLDGYTTGPEVSAEAPLGRGGERLHEWMFAGKSAVSGAQDVMVEGGADIDRQHLNAGLIDEIRLHVAPIVLGGGSPLFAGVRPELRLVPTQATNSPLATHLTYQVDASAVRA
jgi:riboflavin biosynthesis pyrimidine reductase